MSERRVVCILRCLDDPALRTERLDEERKERPPETTIVVDGVSCATQSRHLSP